MRPAIFKNKTLSWIGIILITVIFLIFKEEWSWSTKYPKELIIPFSDWINFLMEKFVSKFGWFFLNISWRPVIVDALWLYFLVLFDAQ